MEPSCPATESMTRALSLHPIDRISFELEEQVLDATKCNVRTVLAGLLVCRAWDSQLAGSQYEHTRIDSPTRLYKLARAVCAFPTARAGLASTRAVIFMYYDVY